MTFFDMRLRRRSLDSYIQYIGRYILQLIAYFSQAVNTMNMNGISTHGTSSALYDAHFHPADIRISKEIPSILQDMIQSGIRGCVANATGEHDWDAVLEIASAHAWIRPAIGIHPWWAAGAGNGWYRKWIQLLDEHPGCLIGEIGLDLAMRDADIHAQREVFRLQMSEAAIRRIPATIHCIRAWKELHEEMKTFIPLESGFLLHSFNGPSESIESWTNAGAYFSVSACEAGSYNPSRIRLLKQIPFERLLIETDAPNRPPPEACSTHPLFDRDTGKRIHHPADLHAALAWLSQILGLPESELAPGLASNYFSLFGHQNAPRLNP